MTNTTDSIEQELENQYAALKPVQGKRTFAKCQECHKPLTEADAYGHDCEVF